MSRSSRAGRHHHCACLLAFLGLYYFSGSLGWCQPLRIRARRRYLVSAQGQPFTEPLYPYFTARPLPRDSLVRTFSTAPDADESRRLVRKESPSPIRKRDRLFSRAKRTMLAARRRWGLGLVRLVVGLVVRIEVAASQDRAEAQKLFSQTLDAVRSGVLDFTRKQDYQFGDITKAAFSRLQESTAQSVLNYTGKETYEFGDITRATVSKFTGKEQYEFGDITKTAIKKMTGKDDYEFGDITKGVLEEVTGKENYDLGDITRAGVSKLSTLLPWRPGKPGNASEREGAAQGSSSK